ncbi:MAG TPA: orotidine-5'-phosphate decarboxylase [Gemmataceae bacterium]|jgi:orotidine-5'-phosphate decarboxylase|nr:orotidine-5'-phosphate decarboxylase [Gemmataceae bacterium]
MTHFADRLLSAVRAKGNALCVGLDPRWENLPQEIRTRHNPDSLDAVARACEEFCLRVLDVVAPLVPVVKPQSAFFEACGPRGMRALQRVLGRARDLGLCTILDSKRNDIASTATAYADAAFGGVLIEGRRFPVWDADSMTVSPYLGRDAIEPFLEAARRDCRGVFVLVRTSNGGSGQFQSLSCEERPLFLHVGAAVRAWSRENLGQCGYGDVGAVIGATHKAELAILRAQMPENIFLVPGFGAQGANAEDTLPAFRADGLGAVVNSSRAILFPYEPDDAHWERKINDAAKQAIAQLAMAQKRDG